MAEGVPENVGFHKPRKLWIESEPYTPDSGHAIDHNISTVEVSPTILKLTHFSKKPILDFGCVKVGKSAERRLLVDNPNPYDVEVVVEKFPLKKHFAVSEDHFIVPEDNTFYLDVTWTPKDSGNYREMITIKYDSSFRVHVLIVGNVESPKKKGKRRVRRPGANKMKILNSFNKGSFQAKLQKSVVYQCNQENIPPLINGDSSSEVESSSMKIRTLSVSEHTSTTARSALSPVYLQSKTVKLKTSFLPSHVTEKTGRDSCGSIMASSELDVPVIDICESPITSLQVDELQFSGKHSIPSEASNEPHPTPRKTTFCIERNSTLPCEEKSVFCDQDITGRPTYIPSVVQSMQTLGACEKQNITDQDGNTDPTNVDRQATIKSNMETAEELTLLDYAISMLEPETAARKISNESDATLDDSLESRGSRSHAVVATNLMPGQTTATCDNVSILHEFKIPDTSPGNLLNVKDRLSSTYSHDRESDLPLPDISAIIQPSKTPKKMKRKSDEEHTPPRSQKTSAPSAKRAFMERIKEGRACPHARRNTRSAGQGTPKGRALQRRRAARLEGILKPTTTKKPKTTKLEKSPTLVGSRRAMKTQKTGKRKLMKGVPLARLVLSTQQPPRGQASGRVILPYSSRNMFYDERWREKQERAFTCWLNYILTPDEFKPNISGEPSLSGKSLKVKSNHSTVFTQNIDKASLNGPALTKEDASLRAYQIRRRLDRLRQSASELFHSSSVLKVVHSIEAAVECGKMKIRGERQMWADLGSRNIILQLILSFNPLWLRVGLEATFGETLPLQHGNDDITGISHFVMRRLLNCDEIKQQYAHSTVPNLFKPGYEECMAKYTLKKLLVLIYFLDQAKQKRLIDHDPCLFRRDSDYRNCRDILVNFSREFLKGEGDIIKHLSLMGYKVSHTQTFIDEFEFGISNIRVDLRDGIRLVRIVELLFLDWNLSPKLRVPAGSILQKRHNVNVALKALEDRLVNICDASDKKVEADHIVKGHREMTLALLWNIAAHFQLVTSVNQDIIKKEIDFLKKNLRLKHKLENTHKLLLGEPDQLYGSANSPVDVVSSLLLEWCRLVCTFKSVPVRNFAASFSDGRALAHLISYYFPNLIPASSICMDTTQSESYFADDDTTSSSAISPISSNQLLKNEKTNLKLVQRAAYELGGIPNLLRIDDITNTIPDDKVVRLLVAFLCSRLLDITIEDRAARTIQIVWRIHKAQKAEKELKYKQAQLELLRNKAALVLQALFKGIMERARYRRLKTAVDIVKQKWKSKKLVMPYRSQFLKQRNAAIVIQSYVRGYLARKCKKQLLLEREKQSVAASKIQSWWKGKKKQRELRKMKSSVLKIEKWYLASRLCRVKRIEYVEYKRTVVYVQRKWKATLEARKQTAIYSTKREAAILIQKIYRGYRARKQHQQLLVDRTKAAALIQRKWRAMIIMKQQRASYLKFRSAVITMQCAVRSYQAKKVLSSKKILLQAVLCVQQKWFAILKAKAARSEYLKMLSAVLVIQRKWRAVMQMREDRTLYLTRRNAIIVLQCKWKATLEMQREQALYVRKVDAIVCIQRRLKASLKMREVRSSYVALRSAVVVIQIAWRAKVMMRLEQTNYQKKRLAVIALQRKWRATIQMRHQKSLYIKMLSAAAAIQRKWRANMEMKAQRNKYQKTYSAAVVIQRRWRGFIMMRMNRSMFLKKHSATVLIQRKWRATMEKRRIRALYLKIISAVIIIQGRWKATAHMQQDHMRYLKIRASVLAIQRKWRAALQMRQQRSEFLKYRNAAITIHNWWRSTMTMKKERLKYLNKLSAVKTVQRKWKATLQMRLQRSLFLKTCSAVATIQIRWIATMKMRQDRARYVKILSAVKKIQVEWRATLQMREEKASFVKICSAVTKIQRCWKATLLMKNDRLSYIQKRYAAIVIQRQFRGYQAAKKLAAELQLKLSAAKKIQQWWRSQMLLKRERAIYLKKKSAVIVLQRKWKATLLMRNQRSLYLLKITAISAIQRKWKDTLKMRCNRSAFLKKRAAAITIQSFTRGHLARRQVCELKKKLALVRLIQRRWRATMEMKKQRGVYIEKRSATIKIQCVVRCFQARKVLSEKKRHRNMVVLIQRKWRATLLMRTECSQYLKMKSSAVILQCAFRCYLAKKIVSAERVQLSVITYIQKKWRATLKMKQERSLYLKKKSAVIILQSAVRRNQAIKIVQKKQRELTAALIIQRRWRATLLMKRQQCLYQKKRDATITLQHVWCCYLTRKILLEKKKQLASIMFIQRKWRATLEMKKTRALFLQKHFAAIMIQCAVRCFIAKKLVASKKLDLVIFSEFEKHKLDAVLLIQRKWRATMEMNKARLKFLAFHSAAINIQRAYRRYCEAQAIQHKKSELKAAIVIQKTWKGFKEKQRFKKICESIRLIQRCFRGYMVRNEMAIYSEIVKARERCSNANQRANDCPELCIEYRMKKALQVLLDVKEYSQIYESLETLATLANLLPECCERILEAGGAEVLCQWIDSSNRSVAAATVHKLSLRVLLTLVRNQSTREITFRILSRVESNKSNSDRPIDLLVNVLSRFRDKGSRDPNHSPIFCSACRILIEFCSEATNVQVMLQNKRAIEMLTYIHRETARRYKTKVQLSEAARLNKRRSNVGYLSLSSKLFDDETDVAERSNFLDVTTRETSFLSGHKGGDKHSSTPKSRKAANNDSEKKSCTTKARPPGHATKKVVKSLYGNAPIPQKVKLSLLPTHTSLQMGVRVHKSRRITKPQSPKFCASKSKPFKVRAEDSWEIKPAEGKKETSTKTEETHQRKIMRVNYRTDSVDDLMGPMQCINKLMNQLRIPG